MNGTGSGGTQEDRNILIVEDEVIIAMALEDSLRDFGYRIAGRATNGADAVRLAIENEPDLALVDIRLNGEMDGIEAANRICRRLDIPVIFLTAYSDDTTLSRAIKTNPFGYLIKPIRPRELYTSIETAIYKHRAIKAETEKLAYISAVTNKLENPVEQVRTSLEGMVTSIERDEMDLLDVSVILHTQVDELSRVTANLRELNNSIFRV
ncbi:MAG TPA: response regulator [Methanoculleus sp.]|nr:response regulator [Methanoculleus sp.]